MLIIIIIVCVIFLFFHIIGRLADKTLDVVFKGIYGRTYNKKDIAKALEEARLELSKGNITQEQFDAFERSIK